jgi:hypothetical protein
LLEYYHLDQRKCISKIEIGSVGKPDDLSIVVLPLEYPSKALV